MKGDTFERKVEKYRKAYELPGANAFLFTESDVLKLLRAQHRAYVRMVKKDLKIYEQAGQKFSTQYMWKAAALRDILRKLNARAK